MPRAARPHATRLAIAAERTRERVVAELHAIASDPACPDEGKVCAVGLLGELGERGVARFSDPSAIQRRSAIALAAQLDSASEIANAADMMLRQLDDDDIAEMIDVMAEATAPAAARLAAELAARLDASPELRARLAPIAAAATPLSRRERPTHASVLVDAAARLVVVASRKVGGERRWRRWAVLIGSSGHIDDCIHSDGTGADGLVDSLVADGYQVASTELDHARALVSAAAQLTAGARVAKLPPAYYLGRDLLDLDDAHLEGRSRVEIVASTLGRAVDLLADGEPVRAHALLASCDASVPDVAAAIAACLVAQGRHADAIVHLQRAADGEKDWPLHHWNLAAALHATGDAHGSDRALRQFLATSVARSALAGDSAQADRIALARRLVSAYERIARLDGKPRRRRRRIVKTR